MALNFYPFLGSTVTLDYVQSGLMVLNSTKCKKIGKVEQFVKNECSCVS